MADSDTEQRALVVAPDRTPAPLANLAARTLATIKVPESALEASRQLTDIWLSSMSPGKRTDFGRVMRRATEDLRVERDAEALAAHECLAHPDCGPVTALGQSGHGHHSDATGLWCWHFNARFLGPDDQPSDSDAASRRRNCCIDGDPTIHKTYPTAGPCEGQWFDDAAFEAGLTAKGAS